MIRFLGRLSRLELVAGLGIALALPAVGSAASLQGASAPALTTQTTLSTEIHDVKGSTQATLTVGVTGQDGLPAAGVVTIQDQGKPLAGAALNAQGQATAVLTLTPGSHSLTAAYAGNATHQASVSDLRPVAAATGTTPDFSITVAPTTVSLAEGQSGSVIASITPINAASLTAPMFVTLSCSGLPDQSSCTFTPENLEVLPNTTAAITSSMVIATAAQGLAHAVPQHPVRSNPVAWAILLPGTLGLAGLAFGARRRRWLSRLSLLGLVAFLAVLGTTACNPQYNFYNHGPGTNLPTPAGSYTLQVTAQSSNGIIAETHSTTMALTVTQ